MACDVAVSAAPVAMTSSLGVQEETVLELTVEQDLRRNVVNKEFMVLYGNDPAKHLPPLPQYERPKSSYSRAWACNNPAMRQLGNLHRRGPRQHLPGSATQRKPALISPELRRPQTAYNDHVKSILSHSFDDRRPRTSEGKMESMEFRQRRQLRPSSVGSSQLAKPTSEVNVLVINHDKTGFDDIEKNASITLPRGVPEIVVNGTKQQKVVNGRLLEVPEHDVPEPEPLLKTPAGGMRRPGRYKGSARRAASSKSNASQHPSGDKQHAEDFLRLLRGDLHFLPPDRPTCVRILLAGTKTDFMKEREALRQEVFPELREFCEGLGYEFEVVDLGIEKGQIPDIARHFRELNNARTSSLGPFYVHFSGDYCPGPVPPPDIPAPDFESIHKMTADLNVENRQLLDVFYRKEENALPPRYVFQHDQVENIDEFRIFINLWQNLVTIAEHANKITTDKRIRYETKAGSEHELHTLFHGVKLSPGQLTGTQCLAYSRHFRDIKAADKTPAKSHYMNIPEEEMTFAFEHNAEKKIISMQDTLRRFLPEENMSCHELNWTGDGVDPENNEEHKKYLEAFVEDFKSTMKTIIMRNNMQWVIKHRNGNMYTPLLEQAKVLLKNSRSFGGREKEQQRLQTYFKDAEICKTPLVISGPTGSGKTALMCAVAKFSKDWIGKSCVPVVRCLGITHPSGDIAQVLVSLCLQICTIYNMDPPPESDFGSVNKMAHHFTNTLELVAKHHASHKPLLVLFDGLEKLKPIDRADTLFWLPKSLPRHVYLMMSVNSKSYMRRLKKRIEIENCFMELGDFEVSELESVLDSILRHCGRKVSDEQKSALLSVFESYPNPLFVSTLAIEAAQWHSWTYPNEASLPETTGEAITRLSFRLEDKFGIKFMQKLMSYLCLLPSGVSERELYDLMCSDQEVLQYIIVQNRLEGDSVMDAFQLIQTRLLEFVSDNSGFITKTSEHGRHLLRWTCEKYRDTCSKKYFGATNPFTGKNDNMDDTIKKMNHLFSVEKPFKIKLKISRKGMQSFHEIKCQTMPYALGPMHSRKLHVLPSLISHSGSEVEFSKQLKDCCLCNYTWLLAKLQCIPNKEIMHDFDQVTEKDHEIDTLRFFLQIARSSLKHDPKSLALQLLGCMPYLDEDYPLLNQMLLDSQNWIENVEGPILVPTFPFFPSPLELCRTKIWNLVDIMQIDVSHRLGVMRNESGYVEIWDLENNELVHALGVRYDRVSPNVFCNSTHVLGINGADLVVWEVESANVVYCVDLEKLLKEAITSMYIFCHSIDFKTVAIHLSDEDFNQAIAFVHLPTGEVLHKLSEFDVKDEFFKSSALFNDSGDRMVFVMARSVVVGDKKSSDFVKLKVFNLERMAVDYSIECGEKKFNKLLLKDANAIVSWTDCSFDVYDVMSGKLRCHLSAPDSRLIIQHCTLTRDNYLVGLSSSPNDVSRKYYALWFWSIEEQTSANLLSQTFENTEEIPKHFVIIEELHLAVLSSPDIATIAIWDLPNSECIFRTKAHIGTVDNVFKTKDPYQIYTCSSSEEVIKLWDIFEVIRKAKEDKVQKSKHRATRSDSASVLSNATTKSILNRDQKVKKPKKVLRKSKSVRFADDESVFSEDVKSTVDFDTVSVATNEANDIALLGNTGRDEYVIATQLDTMQGATWISFSHDGTLLILSTDRSLPTMWEMNNYHVIKRLEPLDDHDVATPWAELACEDKVVVGLTLDEHSKDVLPIVYKYNVWDLSSGEPMHRDCEQPNNVTVCRVNIERDRIILCCLDSHVPGGASEVRFRVLDIKTNECLQEARYSTEAVPTTLQLMDDFSYAVANHVVNPGDASQGFTVYHIEVMNAQEVLQPARYEYRKGTKHKLYRATQNVILPGGQLSLSTGLNGDLQVWDITSREYEGNMFNDPNVKDTRNPNLHNHGSKRIHDMVVSEDGAYLVCAGGNGATSVWDLENEVNIFSYYGHAGEVIKVAISSDNQLILTAGSDLMVNVWKFSVTDRPLCRLHVHSAVTCMHVSSDNKSVALVGQRRNEAPCFMLLQLKNAPEVVEK